MHFSSQETAIKAVKMMNGSVFTGRKLEINMAKYGRYQKNKRNHGYRVDWERFVGISPSMEQVLKSVMAPVAIYFYSFFDFHEARQGPSFIEVVKGIGQERNVISIRREVISINSAWLSNSLVGVVR